MLQLHYEEHESGSATSSLIRQWARKWGATLESVRLRPLTGDDYAYATGLMTEFDEVMDYTTSPQPKGILTHFYSFDCGVPDGVKHPAKTESNAIWSIVGGTSPRIPALIESLKAAGYDVDEAAITLHIQKQKELEAMYERLYGSEDIEV